MKNLIWIWVIVILLACGQTPALSVEDASREFCDCFNGNTIGTIDERLSPCLQQIADKKNDEWADVGLTSQDSIERKLTEFNLSVMLDMTRTCSNYFAAINDLYDNGYPIDTTDVNKTAIIELSGRIRAEENMDLLKSLLHEKVKRLIRAREFELALQGIDSIKSLDDIDYGANLAAAYIFNQQGLHEKAVSEIERAIEISGNENLKLYAEVARQKKRMLER